MNILKKSDLAKLMAENLGKDYIYYKDENETTYKNMVNAFGSYAARFKLKMESKKLMIISDENEAPMLAVRVSYHKG